MFTTEDRLINRISIVEGRFKKISSNGKVIIITDDGREYFGPKNEFVKIK